MPMPREEDDDLFHDVADVEFAEDDAEEKKPKKKTAKKKVVTKKATPKKTTKKTVKKKVKRVSVQADDTPAPAPRKRRKKKVAPAEKAAEESFGAGLFEEGDAAKPEEAAEAPAKPARRKRTRKAAPVDKAPAAEPTSADAPVETSQSADEAPTSQEEAAKGDDPNDKTDEYGRPEPVANYVVHIYEFGRLKRTIARDFTPELAEAYATEFCRTSKRYGRQAVAGKKDTQPAKELEGEQDMLVRDSAPGGK